MAAISGQVATSTFIPKLWEADILRSYEKKLIAKNICAMNPKAPIKKYGDTVHFPGLADPTIGTYIPVGINANQNLVPDGTEAATTISYENLTNTDVTLVIDQAKYFAFQVDDILEAQSNVGVRGSQTQRAGYMLRDDCDKYILGLAPAGVTAGTVTNVVDYSGASSAPTVTAKNVLIAIGQMSRLLDEANIPNEEKFIVIPPWVKLKLALAGIEFSIREGDKARDGVEWNNSMGFDMFVSNNLTALLESTTPVGSMVVGGSKKAIAYAGQIQNTEALRLEDNFAYGVRGLHLYGAKIIRPELLVVGKFKEGEDTDLSSVTVIEQAADGGAGA